MDLFSEPITFTHNMVLLWMLKLLVAVICGAMIGYEREIQRKSAGLRTNILICVGATLYMLSSELIMKAGGGNPDPTRIAGQIVTGMGFIGAGSIIQSRGQITGLTTAATLWVVAAIGIAVGAGYLPFALVVSLVILSVLVGVGKIEYLILGKCRFTTSRVSFHDPTGETQAAISEILNSYHKKIEDFQIKKHKTKQGEIFFMKVPFCLIHPRHKEFLFEILRLPDVRTTRYNPALVETDNLTP